MALFVEVIKRAKTEGNDGWGRGFVINIEIKVCVWLELWPYYETRVLADIT